MRKYIFTFMLLTAGILSPAKAQKQLDSLAYILPEFGQGVIVFSDKQVGQGLFNISPIDQTVLFIDPGKDTLIVAKSAQVTSVSISGRSFYRWNDHFVELLSTDGTTGLGLTRSNTKVNNVQTGAYGMASNAASIKSYGYDPDSGILRPQIPDDPRNYSYKRALCLYKEGKFFNISKKSFQKVFPAQKAYIESLWDERHLTASDEEGVIRLFNEIQGR